MTTALQGSNGKGVGVSVDNLTITGTEGATLDSSPSGGTNVQGLGPGGCGGLGLRSHSGA